MFEDEAVRGNLYHFIVASCNRKPFMMGETQLGVDRKEGRFFSKREKQIHLSETNVVESTHSSPCENPKINLYQITMLRLSAGVVVCREVRKTARRSASSHDYEVLLVRRNAKSSFMPNAYVFPGGKLDPADIRHLEKIGFDRKNVVQLRICAARELYEEVGILMTAIMQQGKRRFPML